MIPENKKFTGLIDPQTKEVAKDLQSLVPVENDTEIWKAMRRGKITASKLHHLKKNKNGSWSEMADTYLFELAWEHITNLDASDFDGSKTTDWGLLYEPEALEEYTKRTGRKLKKAAFIAGEVELTGCTPDSFCGEDGMVEAKCPFTAKNHLRTVIRKIVPVEYLPQVLGQLIFSKRKWCDFISYDPRLTGVHKLAIVRVYADDYTEEMEELKSMIIDFQRYLLQTLEQLNVAPLHIVKKTEQ